ncbi:hypothetical protein [Leptospira yanagawae]|uniref:hypothetical protein n=1 Tax=Leptospira yanagawae TaxID=293069 RepID=UPI000586B0B3|nr:hypothetical protein [Leptospira yanagawae]
MVIQRDLTPKGLVSDIQGLFLWEKANPFPKRIVPSAHPIANLTSTETKRIKPLIDWSEL